MTTLLLALKITIVFGLAGLVSLLLRRGRAAARHLVWGLALTGALALPVLGTITPSMELAVLPPAPKTESVTTAASAGIYTPPRVPPAAAEASAGPVVSRAADARDAGPGFAYPPLIPFLWALGAAIMLALVGGSVVATRRLAARATPVLTGPMVHELDAARTALGIRRPVRLYLAHQAAMPMTWGALRPAVLLPDAASDWSAARRRDVLLHELAHIKRLDWLSQLGARVACAVYWWHPLAWHAARRLREERELACDDLVLRHGAVASDYAHHLLDIARGLRAAPATALAGVAMARPSQLAGRLLAVLDGTRERAGVSRRHAGTAAVAAAAILLPVAAVTAVAGPDTKPDKTKAPVEQPAPETWQADAAATALAPVAWDASAQTLCTWDHLADASASHSNIDDDRVTITIVVDGCELSIRSRGRVRFTDDERDIAELGMDSWFEIEERGRDRARRRAEFDRRDGQLARRWYVDGTERPWDAEAGEWFQGALQVAFRRTSFQARERADRLYARGGGRALMAELERLHSSTAIMVYLTTYADRETISSDEARRIARIAGERISSSSNLSRVLTTLLRHPGIDDGTRADIVAATRRISSSSQRAEVLVSAAEYAPLTPVLADAVLQSAGEISSSSERGRVLTYVGDRLPAEQPLPDSYVRAASGIASSSVLGEVLVSLLERDRLTSEQVVAVLELSGSISSSSERGRVLRAVLQRHPLDDRTRGRFFRQAESISSSSEKGAVLRAVLAANPDPATVGALLDVARTISSSSERANVLVAVAGANLLTSDALVGAYNRAATSISSRSDRERVMRAAGIY